MADQLVLVTGANGFIASRLIPRLLEAGYRVRVLVRNPERLRGRTWLSQVETRSGSTDNAASLADAMQGVHSAYYLIHSMSSGRGYMEIERESARRFADAAENASLQHIIYLGGLADPADPRIAPHMRSRIETGEILRQGAVPVTEFRAGVIAGAGSISFEMIRYLTEGFPVIPGPTWLRNEAQPIASENVIDYLMAGLQKPAVRGGIYEMGGPERMSYADVMLRYARRRGLKRLMFTLPGIPIWWMALVVDRLTPVPYSIATALVGGLQSDSRVIDDSTRRIFPEISLTPFDQAVDGALQELRPERLERVWEGLDGDAIDFRHEGFIVDHRRRTINAPAGVVYERLTRMGRSDPWPYADWLWRLRGWIDRLVRTGERNDHGSNKLQRRQAATRRGRRGMGPQERAAYYSVEAAEPQRLLRLQSTLRAPGQGWMEWRLDGETSGSTILTQTAFFAPRGLPGFLYWIALGPAHRMIFGGLIGALKRRSEAG